MSAERPATRDLILDAAEAVVEREGAGRLTIDGVAAESGISKGGVLYHFPNKLALLKAMVERLVSSVSADIAAAEAAALDAGAPVLPAVVRTLLERFDEASSVPHALLAASAEQPDLLDPVCTMMTTIFERIADATPDPIQARIVLLALDGLKLSSLLGLNHIDENRLPAVCGRLVEMSEALYA
ncbi:TetR/AcrR family transcriptional regulator [Maricaulis sp. CAU 1757]